MRMCSHAIGLQTTQDEANILQLIIFVSKAGPAWRFEVHLLGTQTRCGKLYVCGTVQKGLNIAVHQTVSRGP